MPRYSYATTRPGGDNRCPRCKLHTERCICAHIPSLPTRTKLVLVQHHRETIKPTATGPLALEALSNSELYVHGARSAASDATQRVDLSPLHNEDRRVLLLYPKDDARPLSAELLAEDPRPITLILPDGNWGQASRISRRIPGMAQAEAVTLPEGPPTEWGIREEPHLGGLATFEAIARALGIIEGPAIQEPLEELFRIMVSESIAMRGITPKLHASRTSQMARPSNTASDSRDGNIVGDANASPLPTRAIPLQILHRDPQFVVVNKTSGDLVHRGWANDEDPILQRLRDQLGQRVYPVHRLDRGTSGALLFALDSASAHILQAQFEADRVEKTYIALSRGRRTERLRIDYPLAKEKGGEKRPAVTDVHLLGFSDRYGLYQARPHTGRTHQIRRHFKHLHQPLIGDTRYGTGSHNRFFRETYGFHRLALHCHSLRFAHPTMGAPLLVTAPLPDDFRRLLDALNLLGCIPE